MRILADENIPRCLVDALQRQDHDVTWVRLDTPGATDRAVLAEACKTNRLLLTFDKDFGELAFREGCSTPSCGIILLRLFSATPERLAARVTALVGSRSDWAGHLSVLEEGRIRMTPLPPVGDGPG